jgi:gas vesicle protein
LAGENLDQFRRKGGKKMQQHSCNGYGKFIMGMTTGMMAGMALGVTMAPSHRQIRRAAHKAAKRVNEAVESLTDAMDL